jgi:hypothetical protein
MIFEASGGLEMAEKRSRMEKIFRISKLLVLGGDKRVLEKMRGAMFGWSVAVPRKPSIENHGLV